MRIKFEDITWEMYCEYLGVPYFEPFERPDHIVISSAEGIKHFEKNIQYANLMDLTYEKAMEERDKLKKIQWYDDFLICTLDRDKFLNSGFYEYLINKNRTEIINKALDEKNNG